MGILHAMRSSPFRPAYLVSVFVNRRSSLSNTSTFAKYIRFLGSSLSLPIFYSSTLQSRIPALGFSMLVFSPSLVLFHRPNREKTFTVHSFTTFHIPRLRLCNALNANTEYMLPTSTINKFVRSSSAYKHRDSDHFFSTNLLLSILPSPTLSFSARKIEVHFFVFAIHFSYDGGFF